MATHTPSLRIDPADARRERWKHGVKWSGVRELRMAIDGAHWYGMGGLINQKWPLEKLAFPMSAFRTADAGWNGLLGILDPFWVNSAGIGISVDGDELHLAFNAPLNTSLARHTDEGKKLPNEQRPPLAERLDTDHELVIRGEDLTVLLFEKEDAREAVTAHWEGLPACPSPPRAVFERPMWTTWAAFKNDISQERILQTAEQAKARGFTPGVFGIDAKWQREFGDTSFDPVKFPDPKAMVKTLHGMGCEVTLWIVPFIMPGSENFAEAIEEGFVVKDKDGGPLMGKWWEGLSSFIDVYNPAAMEWFARKLNRLVEQYGIDGFKFDAGEAQFYEQSEEHPNRAASAYLRPLARLYRWSDARAAWRGQDIPVLFRHWDKKTTWGFDNGLASCISQALTLNLLGYRYSFPDMIGGNEWEGDWADEELMIRWTQAVAPMPVIQFSVPPWRKSERCSRVCAHYAGVHRSFAHIYEKLAAEKAPFLRPLWWVAPTDEEALVCDDQYLIGNDFLVAPIIERGARERDVYLPPGRWRRTDRPDEVHEGPGRIKDYPVPLEELPVFARIRP